MPSTSEKQRKFMGAELARKRAGQKTDTGMSEEQLTHYASKPVKKSKPKSKSKGDKSQVTKMFKKGY